MAYFLFIDESGHDHNQSPYEVLAGFAIQDKDLWGFIRDVYELELATFGRRYSSERREVKAKKFLKAKTFKLAAQMLSIELFERTQLAKEALDNGENVTKKQLTALSHAKLAYVQGLLSLCQQYRCKIFGSIVCDHKSIPKDKQMLRRDYIYLFERFYYFLEDKPDEPRGIVVFDEIEKSASHILLNQMDRYFKDTVKGRVRCSLIIPEPFFVHSDLTTGIQVVDFIAYILSWNYRFGKLTKPGRTELNRYMEQIKPLRYRTVRPIGDREEHIIWSISVV